VPSKRWTASTAPVEPGGARFRVGVAMQVRTTIAPGTELQQCNVGSGKSVAFNQIRVGKIVQRWRSQAPAGVLELAKAGATKRLSKDR
jgi:hypothetical protein